MKSRRTTIMYYACVNRERITTLAQAGQECKSHTHTVLYLRPEVPVLLQHWQLHCPDESPLYNKLHSSGMGFPLEFGSIQVVFGAVGVTVYPKSVQWSWGQGSVHDTQDLLCQTRHTCMEFTLCTSMLEEVPDPFVRVKGNCNVIAVIVCNYVLLTLWQQFGKDHMGGHIVHHRTSKYKVHMLYSEAQHCVYRFLVWSEKVMAPKIPNSYKLEV